MVVDNWDRSHSLYDWDRADEFINQVFYISNLWNDKKYFESRMVALSSKQDKKKLIETMYYAPTKILSIKTEEFGDIPFLFLFGGRSDVCKENLQLLDLCIIGFLAYITPFMANVDNQSFNSYYISQFEDAWGTMVCLSLI